MKFKKIEIKPIISAKEAITKYDDYCYVEYYIGTKLHELRCVTPKLCLKHFKNYLQHHFGYRVVQITYFSNKSSCGVDDIWYD